MKDSKIEIAEQQIYKEQQEVAYDTREFTIQYIVDKYLTDFDKDENEIFVPEYQREFVWEEDRQAKFIESIILGLPIPFIFVAEIKESGRFEIVDGSQRIRTLTAFLNDQLVLQKLEKLDKLNGFKFSDLSIPRQRKFKNIPIRMIVLTDKTTEQVRNDMFERINRGSESLRDMEKRKGIYKGAFNNFIYEVCASNEKFQKITPIVRWLKNRQELQELILRFFALTDNYSTYPRNTGIARFLDKYLDEKNKTFTKEEQAEKLKIFTSVIDFVEANFEYGFAKSQIPQVSRIYFEAISVGTLLALKENSSLTVDKYKVNTWLKSQQFREMIAGKYETHNPTRIKQRIEFVRDALLQS